MSYSRWAFLWMGGIAIFLTGCGAPEPEIPPDPDEVDLAEAVRLLDGGKAEEALPLLTAVVARVPTNAAVQVNLGVAYEQVGQPTAAIAAYREAAALAPEDARPLELAARLEVEAGDWDSARRLLDRANRREAYSPRILTAMGVVEYRAGNLDLAEAFFEEAMEADDSALSAIYNAAVLQRDGRKDMERAVGFFEVFIEHAPEDDPRLADVRAFVASHRIAPKPPAAEAKDESTAAPAQPAVPEQKPLPRGAAPAPATPESPAAAAVPAKPEGAQKKEKPLENPANMLWVRALNAHHQGELARAVELYKAALEQDPELFGAWYNLGLVSKAEGDLALAETAFAKALALRPTWVDARFMLGVVVHKRGDDARATELLDQVLEAQPRHVKANYLLAVIYANSGRRGMARTHFEHVLRLDGNGEFGRQAREWLKKNERQSPPMPTR